MDWFLGILIVIGILIWFLYRKKRGIKKPTYKAILSQLLDGNKIYKLVLPYDQGVHLQIYYCDTHKYEGIYRELDTHSSCEVISCHCKGKDITDILLKIKDNIRYSTRVSNKIDDENLYSAILQQLQDKGVPTESLDI